MKIEVNNIPSSTTTEDELKLLFGQYGVVEMVNIIRDDLSSHAGKAYIFMANVDDGERAIAALNGSLFKDAQISVREADDNEVSSDNLL